MARAVLSHIWGAALVAGLALGACSPQEGSAPQSATAGVNDTGCATTTVTGTIALSSEAAADTVEARAFGPSCAQAAVLLTIRDPEGRLLLTFAAPYKQMVFAETPDAPVDAQAVQAFLVSWADVSVGTTGGNVEWPQGQDSLNAPDGPTLYGTDLARDFYMQLRSENLRQVCVATAFEGAGCYAYLPEARSVLELLRMGL
jgi:hypothetical protein